MHRIKGAENFKSGLKTRARKKEWSSTVEKACCRLERERPTAVVSGGAWVAQARRWRASGSGVAAQERCGGTRGRWGRGELGRGGGLEWRAGGARAAAERRTGTGAGRQFREREEQQ